MSLSIKNGQTSVVLRFKLLDSSSTVGAGLTGLTSASSGLIISTIADNEASATAYTVAGSTIESITTLGTYAAPTATKCRFKEVDSTNHKGVYEFQIADARFAVSSAKSLLISIAGATNLVQADYLMPLVVDDPYTAKLTSASLPSNFSSFSIDGSGRVDVAKIAGTAQTARDIGASVLVAGDLSATMKTSVTTAATAATPTAAAVTGAVGSVTGAVGSVTGNVGGNVTGSVGSISGITFPTRFSSLAIDVSGNVTFGNTSIATVTNLTNAPTSGDFTAAMKTSLNAATPAATLSGDFSATMKTSLNAATPAVTVSDKTGFSLASGGLAAVTAWSVAITGNITGNLSGSVGSVTGLTASDVGSIKTTLGTAGAGLTALGDTRIAHLDADVSSRSTFAGGAVASVTGSVGSVVGLTASNLDATISSRLATSSYTAPDNADIAAIKIKTDHLPDSDIVNTLGKLWVLDGAGNAVAPASAIASLPTASQMADEVEVRTLLANIIKVNGVTVNGNGAGTPWGP